MKEQILEITLFFKSIKVNDSDLINFSLINIGNVNQFIEMHVAMINGGSGRMVKKPYYDRLVQLKDYLNVR